MKRFGLVVLTLAALGLGSADTRPAAARPVGYGSASDLVEAQYRPYRRSYRGVPGSGLAWWTVRFLAHGGTGASHAVGAGAG
jgi:hypothetical protein